MGRPAAIDQLVPVHKDGTTTYVKASDVLLSALRAGATVEDAAASAGVGTSSYYRWIERGAAEQERVDAAHEALEALPPKASKKRRRDAEKACEPHPDEEVFRSFREAATRARAQARVHAVTVLQRHMKDDWRAAAFFLERQDRVNWGKQVDLTHRGDSDSPVAVNVGVGVSDEVTGAAHDFLRSVAKDRDARAAEARQQG
jgi:hypothetical protein